MDCRFEQGARAGHMGRHCKQGHATAEGDVVSVDDLGGDFVDEDASGEGGRVPLLQTGPRDGGGGHRLHE